MARLKINVPSNKIFAVTIPVRIGDINYGNHVGNDAFISILHEARVQWLHMYSFTELNVAGVGLIMSDVAMEFKQESFYGDSIEVQLSCGESSGVGFELYYQLFTTRNGEQCLLANAKTGMVCYDYATKKVSAIPGVLKNILQAH
jgi:acyl-CoA thioesterase FadM